jgi:hypothetical protein
MEKLLLLLQTIRATSAAEHLQAVQDMTQELRTEFCSDLYGDHRSLRVSRPIETLKALQASGHQAIETMSHLIELPSVSEELRALHNELKACVATIEHTLSEEEIKEESRKKQDSRAR